MLEVLRPQIRGRMSHLAPRKNVKTGRAVRIVTATAATPLPVDRVGSIEGRGGMHREAGQRGEHLECGGDGAMQQVCLPWSCEHTLFVQPACRVSWSVSGCRGVMVSWRRVLWRYEIQPNRSPESEMSKVET